MLFGVKGNAYPPPHCPGFILFHLPVKYWACSRAWRNHGAANLSFQTISPLPLKLSGMLSGMKTRSYGTLQASISCITVWEAQKHCAFPWNGNMWCRSPCKSSTCIWDGVMAFRWMGPKNTQEFLCVGSTLDFFIFLYHQEHNNWNVTYFCDFGSELFGFLWNPY